MTRRIGAPIMKKNKDTEEKNAVGQLWEARSNGMCIFRLVGKDNYQAALHAILY